MGIEPTSPAWKAGALPLCYARKGHAPIRTPRTRLHQCCCNRQDGSGCDQNWWSEVSTGLVAQAGLRHQSTQRRRRHGQFTETGGQEPNSAPITFNRTRRKPMRAGCAARNVPLQIVGRQAGLSRGLRQQCAQALIENSVVFTFGNVARNSVLSWISDVGFLFGSCVSGQNLVASEPALSAMTFASEALFFWLRRRQTRERIWSIPLQGGKDCRYKTSSAACISCAGFSMADVRATFLHFLVDSIPSFPVVCGAAWKTVLAWWDTPQRDRY